jgi:hypothetical protein
MFDTYFGNTPNRRVESADIAATIANYLNIRSHRDRSEIL